MTSANVSSESARVAVTGTALLSPLGDTVDAVFAALERGERAIGSATHDALADLGDVAVARIASFDADRYAKVRGMRVYNRTTQLAICAATLALKDAHIDLEQCNGDDVGIVMASTFGHLDTLIEYDRSLLANGIARTNPALMPLGLPSAPGAATALAFRAKAFSITLADGGTSSLDALGLARRLLLAGRARTCIVVSASSPARELAVSCARAGRLAAPDDVRVFDRRSRGSALGEGAAAVVLERIDVARERGAVPRGFVCAHAATLARTRALRTAAQHRAATSALRSAALSPSDVALVSSGANGVPDDDAAEARALVDVFANNGAHPTIAAARANLGDAIDAGGLVDTTLALEALRVGRAPAIALLEEPVCGELRWARDVLAIDGHRALVTATSWSGACAALVVEGVHHV